MTAVGVTQRTRRDALLQGCLVSGGQGSNPLAFPLVFHERFSSNEGQDYNHAVGATDEGIESQRLLSGQGRRSECTLS